MRTTFRGSADHHVLNITRADSSISPAFSTAATGRPGSRLLAIIGAAYNQPEAYPREELLKAAEEFQEALEQQRDVVPYRYSYEMRLGEIHTRGSGGAGGFHIDGKVHSIWGGAGVCYLEEQGVRPNGWGYSVRTIDVRDKKSIETDDFGPIKISRRKLKITLFDTIPPLVAFLRSSKEKYYEVLTTEGAPSLMDLVHVVGKGGGGEDWAGEQIYEMGQDGRDALIEKLHDPKAKKHYPTIVKLLLTVFPSSESKQAVTDLLDREQDEERKKAYMLWLAVTRDKDSE